MEPDLRHQLFKEEFFLQLPAHGHSLDSQCIHLDMATNVCVVHFPFSSLQRDANYQNVEFADLKNIERMSHSSRMIGTTTIALKVTVIAVNSRQIFVVTSDVTVIEFFMEPVN